MVTITYAVCFLAVLVLQTYGAELDADAYLEKYGYLDLFGRSGGGHQRSLAKTRAIKAFQDFANLPVTGQLDEPTKKAMLAPRCGIVDKPRTGTRAAFYSKWNKSVLKWALEKSTTQLDAGRIRSAIKQAFDVWAKVIPMNFTEVAAGSGADMQFSFGTKDHGDGFHFDGNGGVLAHAFFPSDGRLHFDDEEKWAFEDGKKIKEGSFTDLLSVTIHELGHSLGLPHSNEQDAIMYPFYRAPDVESNGNLKQFQLSHFDIADIQNIYGPRAGGVTQAPPAPEATPPGRPSGAACPRFDAAVTGVDGATYFFSNAASDIGYTKANVNDPPNSASKFYISRRFPGAPSSGITAGLVDRLGQLTILFQRRRVYAYSWRSSSKSFSLEPGYPKDLQNDVPFEPEGAFQLKEGHLILFKGDDFVIWEPSSNKANFKNSIKSYFKGVPSNAKVSFAAGEDKLYFVNAADYSVYDFRSSAIVSTQPLKTLITC